LVCFTGFVPFRLPCVSLSFRHLKDFHVFSDFCHRIPAVISSAFWCLVSTPATFLSAQCSYFLFRSAGLARGCGRMALASSVISFALSTPQPRQADSKLRHDQHRHWIRNPRHVSTSHRHRRFAPRIAFDKRTPHDQPRVSALQPFESTV